jgi:hypothetical protein
MDNKLLFALITGDAHESGTIRSSLQTPKLLIKSDQTKRFSIFPLLYRDVRERNHCRLTRSSFANKTQSDFSPSFLFPLSHLTVNERKLSERISLPILEHQIRRVLHKHRAFSARQNVKVISTISFSNDRLILKTQSESETPRTHTSLQTFRYSTSNMAR